MRASLSRGSPSRHSHIKNNTSSAGLLPTCIVKVHLHAQKRTVNHLFDHRAFNTPHHELRWGAVTGQANAEPE